MGPAWITGRKVPPRPPLGVVLLPFKRYMVVTQEDERVRTGTRAEDMAMAVDVAGRDQCRDIAAVHGALVGKAQVRPAALLWSPGSGFQVGVTRRRAVLFGPKACSGSCGRAAVPM